MDRVVDPSPLGVEPHGPFGRQGGARDRIAIAAAGDDRAAVVAVMQLIDRLRFDTVDAGPLEAGLELEPDVDRKLGVRSRSWVARTWAERPQLR